MTQKLPLLEPTEALTLAALLADFEIESAAAQPGTSNWLTEMRRLKFTLETMAARPPAERFFFSPGERRKKVNLSPTGQ